MTNFSGSHTFPLTATPKIRQPSISTAFESKFFRICAAASILVNKIHLSSRLGVGRRTNKTLLLRKRQQRKSTLLGVMGSRVIGRYSEPYKSWPRTDRSGDPWLLPYMPCGIHRHEAESLTRIACIKGALWAERGKRYFSSSPHSVPSSWASRKILRSPRLAHKAPVVQATSTMDVVGPGTVTSKGKKVKNSKELLSRRSRAQVRASLPTPLRHTHTPQPRPCCRGIAPRLREWLHVLRHKSYDCVSVSPSSWVCHPYSQRFYQGKNLTMSTAIRTPEIKFTKVCHLG